MLDSMAPPVEAATRAADPGTPATPQEYSPDTTLADRDGQLWRAHSTRIRVYPDGTAPFEAWDIARAWAKFGPFTVVDAAGHKMLHRRPFPGCHNCPPAPCRCGNDGCTNFDAHYREWASTETAWRRAA